MRERMKKAKIFEETYTNYLNKLAKLDLKKCAQNLGAEFSNNRLIIPFYNNTFSVTEEGITGVEGSSPSFAVKVVLCKYILMCPQKKFLVNTSLVTYREFKDAGPLTSYFTNNTNKTLEVSFSGKLAVLRDKCLSIGGTEKESSTYDLSMVFYALPKVPVILNFNDSDEMFSAGCSVLYQASAEKYLDMECLAITGTYLTGLLI